jgi:hypothetical protein
VLDVRRRHTDDGKAAAPGESLEFLAQIRGWQSEERKRRKAQLLQLNDIGLRVALGHAVGTDVFFITESTLCEGDHGARRRRMVVSSTVNHKVQGVSIKEAEGRAGTLRFTQRSSNTL